MNQKTKTVVVVILGFAAIGSTATLVRIPYIHSLKTRQDFLCMWPSFSGESIRLTIGADETTDVAIWSTIEPGVGITAACIATLRPLLQIVFKKTGLSSDERTHPSRFTPNWSSGNHLSSKKAGYVRSPSYSHGMDNLQADGSGIRSTVTGGNSKKSQLESDGDSEEHPFASTGMNISKSVEVTHVTETAPPRRMERRSDDSMV